MIGMIDEAKGKAKADQPSVPAKPDSKADPKPAAASPTKAPLAPKSKPKPEVEHAAGTHES
jgi:hypothetical protein